MRWCTHGRHRVSLEACQDDDGVIRATCNTCRGRRVQNAAVSHQTMAGDEQARLQEENDTEDPPAPDPIQDEYDELLNDGDDVFYMNIDLPEDSAVTTDEAACLKQFDAALERLKLETCLTCNETGFDLNLVENECRRCRMDKGGPTKKFLFENNATPCKDIIFCLHNYTSTDTYLGFSTRTTCMSEGIDGDGRATDFPGNYYDAGQVHQRTTALL